MILARYRRTKGIRAWAHWFFLLAVVGVNGCSSTGSPPPPPHPTPPTAPGGLTATSASSTQINLAWTASTDNVGVTEYKVERCQAIGCTTFSQIATSTGTTYDDTGLAASTSYSYRVRATDAAGNVSTYSNTASAATSAASDATVELHWESWDLKAEDPPYFPDSGEPEDYILGQPDSPSASAALGELWEVIVPDAARILHPKPVADSYEDLLLDLSTWNGADLFKSDGYATILFSERGREWFSEHWGAYVKFQEFPTT